MKSDGEGLGRPYAQLPAWALRGRKSAAFARDRRGETREESTSVESSKVTQELMAVTAVVNLVERGSGPKGKPTRSDRDRGAEPIAREGRRTTRCEE